ncbi:MAG: D-2-hydroxyacid dehydrogenase [Deltaproteobacteria bacterium]|jgi:phosphoglycerate dehydrogenase-like enzyme|nr:D-2-hydroxyacid dehydrogenase [Deltaproteobacteria bacterium]
MAPAIHVYHDSHAEWIADKVRKAAPQRRVVALAGGQALRTAISEIEVLLASEPPREGWGRASELRLIQLMGVGAEMLLPSPDLPDHVEVAGLRGLFAPEVAEHAVAMLLALTRNLHHWFGEQAARHFEQKPLPRLAAKSCLIVGLGEVGRRIARIAKAMDMRVVGVRKREGPVANVDRVLAPEGLDLALAEAEVVFIAVPRTAATTGLFDHRRLSLLPQGALVINVARGGIVDERALESLLRDQHLGGAALDVFDAEPLSADSSLWTAPNLLITPHVAGFGEDYLERGLGVLADNVARLEEGAPLLHLIDRPAGY